MEKRSAQIFKFKFRHARFQSECHSSYLSWMSCLKSSNSPSSHVIAAGMWSALRSTICNIFCSAECANEFSWLSNWSGSRSESQIGTVGLTLASCGRSVTSGKLTCLVHTVQHITNTQGAQKNVYSDDIWNDLKLHMKRRVLKRRSKVARPGAALS